MSGHCEACLTLPTVIPTGYVTKGSYVKVAGLDVYVVGSPSASRAIIDIYDAFGMASQTIQGADILSETLDALVLVPDFFKGKPAKHEWFPPNTEEKTQLVTQFFSERAAFPGHIDVLLKVLSESKENYPSIVSWGTVGLCWGGKIAALTSSATTPFAATAQVHPGGMAKEDALEITIPHMVLASKDEPADVVADYKTIIESKANGGVVETYGTMHHGWLGARANLEDDENLTEYKHGYSQLAEFFKRHL